MRIKKWNPGTRACDVCHHILNEWKKGSHRVFAHPGGTYSDDGDLFDHAPVPVPLDQIEDPQTICDMCVAASATWIYDGPNALDAGRGHQVVTGGEWGICDICDYHIQRKDYEPLWDRIMRHSPSIKYLRGRDERAAFRAKMAVTHMPYILGVYARERLDPQPQFRPALRPASLPKTRDRLAKLLRTDAFNRRIVAASHHPDGINLPGVCIDRPEQPTMHIHGAEPTHVDAFTRRLSDNLYVGDIAYISAQFARLVRLVAYDLEHIKLHDEDLPDGVNSGLIIWEEPIHTFPHADERPLDIIAVSWMRIPGGIWTSFYTHPKQIWPGEDPLKQTQDEGWLTMLAPGAAIPFNTTIDTDQLGPYSIWSLALLATFIFLKQPGVVDHEPVEIDKDLRKQYGRARRQAPSVRFYYLRKRPKKVRETPADIGKKWEYRRYVKAHTKDQAYGPNWSLRRTIIVSPYIAGNEDLPLRINDGQTVKILK